MKDINEFLKKIPNPIYFTDAAELLAEADYYGASRLIADDLGLIQIPFSKSGWRHGWMHFPLKYVRQLTVWGSNDAHYLTAKEEHALFLANNGIKATAVGMPFIYANRIDKTLRVPKTLLVMPQHTLPNIPIIGNEEQYIKEIEKIRDDFNAVVFCIHHSCYEHGIWPELLKKYNFPMIIGASANQENAIIRLHKMFSMFEFVTTNTIGSHIPYAAYCGAKVSIYGEFSDFYKYNIKNDKYYIANKELIDFAYQYTREEYVREMLPFMFCEHPKNAVQSICWAQNELGLENKKTSLEIADLLGWNDAEFQRDAAKERMLKIKNKQKELTIESIVSMIELAEKHHEQFAIYGAGHVGMLMLKVLEKVNLKPKCFFDRNYNELTEFNGIEVKNPEKIASSGLGLILVASFAYKDEIRCRINNIDESICVWVGD